jgi:hypothetical protein
MKKYSFLLLLFVYSCSNSFENLFDHEPMITEAYISETDKTQFATRNMMIDNRGCEGNTICSLILQGVIVSNGKPEEVQGVERIVLRFRGLSKFPRFQENQSMNLNLVDGKQFSTQFTLTGISQGSMFIHEDFYIEISDSVLTEWANAKTVTGTIGPLKVEVSESELEPLKFLAERSYALTQ